MIEQRKNYWGLSESARSFLASAAAGLTGRCVCHPMDTVKAQLQAGKPAVWKLRALYRGVGVALLGGIPATAIYLNTYDYAKDWLTDRNTSIPSFAVFLGAGMVAETVSCIIFVPVDVIKERMQVQGVRATASAKAGTYYRNSIDAVKQIARSEGVFRGLYKGYGATLLSFGPFSAIYFALYEGLKPEVAQYLSSAASSSSSNGSSSKSEKGTFVSNLIASASAGAIASWVTNPLDLAKLRMQIARMGEAPSGAAAAGLNLDSTAGMLRYVYRSNGLQGLYRGAFTRIFFHAPNTAVTIVAFEEAKKLLEVGQGAFT